MRNTWNKKILRSYQIKKGWQPYDGPNSGHMHISLSPAGADKRTSFWKR